MANTLELAWRDSNVDTSNVCTTIYDSVEVGDQHLTVVEVDGRTGNGDGVTFIEPPSLEAWADTLQTKRTEILIANAARNHTGGARGLFVEMPGVNRNLVHRDKLTDEQFRQSLTGRLRAHAATQLDALKQVANFQSGEQVRFYGYSQAGRLSAELIERIVDDEALDLEITGVDLFEVPNLGDVNPARLAYGGIRESMFLDRYLVTQNKARAGDVGQMVLPADREDPAMDFGAVRRHQRAARLLPLLALRRGIAPELKVLQDRSRKQNSSTGFHEAKVTVWEADGSRLTQTAYCRAAAELLGGDYRVLVPSQLDRKNGEKVQHHALLGLGNTAVIGAAL